MSVFPFFRVRGKYNHTKSLVLLALHFSRGALGLRALYWSTAISYHSLGTLLSKYVHWRYILRHTTKQGQFRYSLAAKGKRIIYERMSLQTRLRLIDELRLVRSWSFVCWSDGNGGYLAFKRNSFTIEVFDKLPASALVVKSLGEAMDRRDAALKRGGNGDKQG